MAEGGASSDRAECPAPGALPSPALQTAALQRCGALELRLGVHSTAVGAATGVLAGVATAVRAIEADGLLAAHNTSVVAVYRPLNYSRPYAVRAALELAQGDRVAAVIGGGSSSRTILGQYVFGMAGIPQVGVTSTAPTLSDQGTYPTFSRVVPSDEAQGQMLAEVVADFGWTYMSVLATTDDYARELTTIFQDAAARQGVRVMVTQTFGLLEDGGEVDLDAQMQTLQRSKTNIFALICGNTDSARAALSAAAEAGLAGPSFVWMGVDGWFDPGFPEQAGPGAQAAAAGALGLTPYVARRGPAWETFLRQWRTTPPPELDPGAAISADAACPAECRAEPPWGAAYAYDATMLVAKAWAKALEDGGDPRDLVAGDLLRAIRAVQYVGLTGNVTLGARGQPAAAKYTVHQFVPGVGLDGLEWAAVGTVDDAAEGLQFFREEHGTASSTSSSAYRQRPVDFGLGPGVIPEDGSHTSADESVPFFLAPLGRDGQHNQDEFAANCEWYLLQRRESLGECAGN